MKVNDVSTQAQKLRNGFTLIDDLMGGTRAMREASTRYLPKRPLEEQSDYDARLAAATLLPAFSETVNAMSGRAFADPMTVNEDVPEWIASEVLPDVDRQGRNLHVFASEWFHEAVAYGLSHVIVESPPSQARTREQQRAAGLRPYLVRVHPRDVLGWRVADDKLTQVRIQFSREEDDGEFGTKTVEEIRVYEPQRVRVFQKAKDEWVFVDEFPNALDRVPIITLYTNRTGMMTATPPLRELAYLNAKHFRMQSANDTLIDTASVPILALSGVDSGDEVVIGAKHALRLPNGATATYVEHSGAAIGAGQDALKALVEDMRRAGSKLIDPQNGTKTATQAGEEASRENSPLGEMVQRLEDTLHDVLDLIAEYRGESTGGTVTMHPNLDPDLDPATTVTTLESLHREGIVSKQTVFEAARSRKMIPDDTQWEDEQIRIKEQDAA